MKATYNRAMLEARGIMQQTARENGVTYGEVYEGFQNTIRHGLASTDPQAVQFWKDVKRQAKKEVPAPEDLLAYISAMSRGSSGHRRAMKYAGPVFH